MTVASPTAGFSCNRGHAGPIYAIKIVNASFNDFIVCDAGLRFRTGADDFRTVSASFVENGRQMPIFEYGGLKVLAGNSQLIDVWLTFQELEYAEIDHCFVIDSLGVTHRGFHSDRAGVTDGLVVHETHLRYC
jgi:hypothetical protein